MKNLLVLLSIVYALFISAECIQCKTCLNRNGKTCSGESVDCKEGCVTIAGFTKFGSDTFPFIYKGCKTDIKCQEWLCISSEGLDFQSFINCCYEENCNPDYYIPYDDVPENGVTCPYCYEEDNADGCKHETEVQCRGNDTLCVEYRGRIQRPDGPQPRTSFKSCANTLGFNNFTAFYGVQECERNLFALIQPVHVQLKPLNCTDH